MNIPLLKVQTLYIEVNNYCVSLIIMSSKMLATLTFTILLMSFVGTSGPVAISLDTSQQVLAQDSFELHGPQNRTFSKDNTTRSIVWWVENTTSATFSFDVFKNGTLELSGLFESVSDTLGGPYYVHPVPVIEMDLGNYNYTMVVTDGVSTKSSKIMIYLVESTITVQPWYTTTIMLVAVLTFGFVGIVFLIWVIQHARSRPK